MKKEGNIIRLAFYVLFGVLGVFILLTPHIIAGHFFISKNYAETIALLADMIIGYFFYSFYQKKMKSIYNEKVQAEKKLISSYDYIGKINNIVDIFKGFGRPFSQNHAESNENEIFKALLSNMIISVARAEKGFLRFIDIKSGGTLKEFYFSRSGDDFRIKVSNKAVLERRQGGMEGVLIIESDYKDSGICCIICIVRGKDIDTELAKSLLNQTHLLYLVFNKKNTHKNYGT